MQVMHIIFNNVFYSRDYFLFNYKMIKCMVIFLYEFSYKEKKIVIGMCGRDNKSKSLIINGEIVFL